MQGYIDAQVSAISSAFPFSAAFTGLRAARTRRNSLQFINIKFIRTHEPAAFQHPNALQPKLCEEKIISVVSNLL